jgi:Ca2+-binding RTX toxin-like protein
VVQAPALGGSGNDVLCGLGGDDVLDGGTGLDHHDGGTGVDQLFGRSGLVTLINGEVNNGGTGSDRELQFDQTDYPCNIGQCWARFVRQG